MVVSNSYGGSWRRNLSGGESMDYLRTIIPVGMYKLANSYYSMSANDPSDWRAWVAIGKGSVDWTTFEVPTPLSTQLLLYDEIARVEPMWAGYLDETLYDLSEIQYSATQTKVLRYVAEFSSDTLSKLGLTGVYLREYGLFMDGMHLKDSGDPCLFVDHSRFWWDAGVRLRREIIMDLRGE